ncbi:SDR family oxidoreductase [Candidatus Gracilibacteria bacterium]|nr:SDR family oxidoreductase [Candidatus Gracilibacteria bacterium]
MCTIHVVAVLQEKGRKVQGKTILITGATSGIGKITALELARQGALVVMMVRNAAKGEAVRSEIVRQTGNDRVELLVADLAALADVRRAAAEFKTRHTRLDVLVNNAGLFLNSRKESADGYEATFAINHLAHFLLTELLRDTLIASTPARVVTVSSEAHQAGHINFDNLHESRNYSGWRAYANSKLANVLFAYGLARRLAGSGVTSNALHPGFVATGFGDGNGSFFDFAFKLIRPFAKTPEQGAATSIYLAAAAEVAGITGEYYVDSAPRRSNRESYDQVVQDKLWQVSATLVGLTEPTAMGAIGGGGERF